VTADVLERDRDIQRARAANEGKPPAVIEKMIEGRLSKFYEEICLMEQPFIKDNTLTVSQLVKTKISKLGENISVARFSRFKVGDTTPAEGATEEQA
jgi:elongation factor Ts